MSVGTQYIDILWLKTFGLFKGKVLDYFYTSPFFDQTSNNHLIRTQGVAHDHLVSMVGVEYVLDELNMSEPNLYVIKKQRRESSRKAELLDIYYVIDGIIHQSPDLLQLVRSRVSKAAHHLGRSFQELQSTTTFTSKQGHKCWMQPPDGDAAGGGGVGEGAGGFERGGKKAKTAASAGSILEFPSFVRVFEDLKTL